ncbi:MAG: hypothetical protein HXY20_02225 [Acidobacteria bacterium]|nr:hypothetical protein [Acidobacteriota bacterium]
MERRTFLMTPLGVIAVAATRMSLESYKVENAGACTLPEVSEKMKQILQREGLRVADGQETLCELWLRAVVPQNAGSTGAQYDTVANGTFAGIIRYPGRAGDYRGQTIKPGVYTMRFQTMPADGNHMGCAPSADFVLLIPAGADEDPDAVLEYEKMVELSRRGAGTSHPVPLYLTLPEGQGKQAFRPADEHHWAVETNTRAQPSGGAEVDFPVAIILIGKSEG